MEWVAVPLRSASALRSAEDPDDYGPRWPRQGCLTGSMGEPTDGPEADLVRREADLMAREAALEKRLEAAQAILGAADARDVRADNRDDSADQRESDSDREKLLNQAGPGEYGDDWPQGRNAGLDRAHAKNDRAASHGDRVLLTESHTDDEADPPSVMAP